MRKRRLALLAATTAATMAVSVPSAFGASNGQGRGATIDEFVCFRSTGDQIRLGTGKVITTPSGNVNAVCTGKPLSAGKPPQPVDSEPEPDDPGLEPEPVPGLEPEPDPEPAG